MANETSNDHHTDLVNKGKLKREAKLFEIGVLLAEVFFIIIYGVWFDYHHVPDNDPEVPRLYAYFRDVNIMIFFGFGFLMTFLRKYGYSAIGYTFLISALVTQWSLILEAFAFTVYDDDNGIKFKTWHIGIVEALDGLFCSGSVMIAFGAILGKVTPLQMLIMGLIQPMFFWLNFFLGIKHVGAIDIGGGMTIHLFGAVFGLVVTWFLTNSRTKVHKDNAPAYYSDLFSFAGTLFLFMMWPSFNAAVARAGMGEQRALLNTFFSITSSVLSTFIVSRLLCNDRFEAVHVQNSALAGGVVMGVAADLHLTLAGAMTCGFVVGAISVVGFRYLTPWLTKRGVQDVCGIVNLHCIPGFLSAIVAVFGTLAANRDPERYHGQYELYIPHGDKQPGLQMAATLISIVCGVVGGLLAGFLMKFSNRINSVPEDKYFNDDAFWHVPPDFYNPMADAKPGEEELDVMTHNPSSASTDKLTE